MSTIQVIDIGKAYKKYTSHWSRLMEWILPFSKPRHQLIWALQDINFEVHQGEAVGIVGINGAGKSTLLKVITGTTKPTTGNVEISGRIAALLELGMGFHPEFTGRQNVFMAGQLAGLSVPEITKLMPEIEAFAEIDEYIDQPIRIYSSGMEIRLAFSVATAIRPDVLIVDEALAVGDAYFQHKSFARIKEFKKKGTSILLVSHDKTAIQSLCDRAVLIENGKLIKVDKPNILMDYYNAIILGKERKNIAINNEGHNIKTIHGSKEATITSVGIFNTEDQLLKDIQTGEKAYILINVSIRKKISELNIGFLIKDKYGQEIYGTNTHNHGIKLEQLDENMAISCRIDLEMNIGPGNHSISVAAVKSGVRHERNYEWIENAYVFTVHNIDQPDFVGTASIPTEFSLKITNE